MQRILCANTVTDKGGGNRPCSRYLGELAEGSISLKCPRCGGTTHVAFQQGISMDQLASLLGGISCESPKEGLGVAEHIGSIDKQPI